MTTLAIKRIYEQPETSDGFRVYIDKLWARGLKKEEAHFDQWFKDIAPSNELRQWFNHDPEKWQGFCEKYQNELANNLQFEAFRQLVAQHDKVTLLYSAKDTQHNNAVVLHDYLTQCTRCT